MMCAGSRFEVDPPFPHIRSPSASCARYGPTRAAGRLLDVRRPRVRRGLAAATNPQAQTIVSPTERSAIASASAAPLGLPARTQRRWRIAAITMAAARLATGYTRPRFTTSVRVTAASPAPVSATKRRVCSARAKRYIESKPKKNATNTATA